MSCFLLLDKESMLEDRQVQEGLIDAAPAGCTEVAAADQPYQPVQRLGQRRRPVAGSLQGLASALVPEGHPRLEAPAAPPRAAADGRR